MKNINKLQELKEKFYKDPNQDITKNFQFINLNINKQVIEITRDMQLFQLRRIQLIQTNCE